MPIDIKQKLQDLQTACSRARVYGSQLEPMVVHDVAHAARLEIQRLEALLPQAPQCSCGEPRSGLHARWCPKAATRDVLAGID